MELMPPLPDADHAAGGDPFPYGVEPNRAVLEELIDHAVAQRILRRRPSVESLFVALP